MSDIGRKDFSDKVSETLTPESQKGLGDKAKEAATDAYDTVAKNVQPEESKSVGQKAGDVFDDSKKSVGSATDEAGKSYTEQLSEGAKNLLDTAGQFVQEASEKLKGTTAGTGTTGTTTTGTAAGTNTKV